MPSELPPSRQGIDRFDPESPAYIGRRLPLDGVGGVSTLVRATAHRYAPLSEFFFVLLLKAHRFLDHRVGGIFPAFVVDHQVETEGATEAKMAESFSDPSAEHDFSFTGFAVLARTLGARICGLPNYGVLHASPH